ncbi:cell fusion protein aff-1-like [Tachypleus tridentatus]|uniref:cell fusion protein aff-1-like n=1 Tax=Tachypleus tridentatus TaxID=6853 RepID=UPI003FCF6238
MAPKESQLVIYTALVVFAQGYVAEFRCDETLPIVTRVTFESRDQKGLTLEGTVARIPLTLGQTLCISVIIREESEEGRFFDGGHRKRIVYAIRLEAVWNEYPVQNLYYFSQASVKLSCYCDCPGGNDKCAPEYGNHMCHNQDSSAVCYQFYTVSASKGCLLHFLKSEADVCCKVWMMPNLVKGNYTALQLGAPRTKIRIMKVALNGHSEPMGQPDYLETYSTEGRFSSETFEIELTSVKQENHLQQGMYFVNSAGDVYQTTHVRLNEPGTYDLTKLGWLKYTNKFYPPARSAVLSKTTVKVYHCRTNKIFFQHSIVTDEPELVSASVRDLYKHNVKKVTYNMVEQRVEEILSNVHRINFNFYLREVADVIFHYQPSVLHDFNAEIILDKYSNEFLNISLKGISGTVLGWVMHEHRKKSYFSIDSKYKEPQNLIVYKSIGFCANHTKLCLRAVSVKTPLCKYIGCKKEPLEGVIRQDGTYGDVDVLEEDYHPWDAEGLDLLLALINPLNWFSGWKGTGAMVLQVILAFLVIVLITKIITCIRK